MKKALVYNGKIQQVEDTEFPVSKSMMWIDCPDDCTTEWTYNEGNLQPPVVSQRTLDQAKEELKKIRDTYINEGVTVDASDISSMTTAILTRVQTAFIKEKYHLDNLTEENAASYDLTTGW